MVQESSGLLTWSWTVPLRTRGALGPCARSLYTVFFGEPRGHGSPLGPPEWAWLSSGLWAVPHNILKPNPLVLAGGFVFYLPAFRGNNQVILTFIVFPFGLVISFRGISWSKYLPCLLLSFSEASLLSPCTVPWKAATVTASWNVADHL